MEPIRCFEALEARALLSAPVATVQSFTLTASSMTVVVAYSADDGIDPTSIGGLRGLGMTGPNVSMYDPYPEIVSQQPTQTVVRYGFSMGEFRQGNFVPSLWTNGTYNFGIPAGSVRSQGGDVNQDTAAGSYWLWYPDKYVEMGSMTLSPTGLSVSVGLFRRNPGVDDAQTSVQLTAPDGSQRVETLAAPGQNGGTFAIAFQNQDGRGWDYTDPHGAFVISLADYDGGQVVGYRPTAQYWLWFSNPKVEILSTNVADSYVEYTARFSDDHGIDLTSFAWSNITVTGGPYTIPPLLDGSFPAGPRVEPQADGSVIATYRRAEYQRLFTNRESGDWTYFTQAGNELVRDVDGNGTSVAVLRRENHVFTTIGSSDAYLTAHAADPTFVSITADFFANHVDTTTFGDGDVRMELNGHTYQLSLTLWGLGSNNDTPVFYATYALQLGAGERLDSGTANFYLNAGAVTVSGLPSADSFVGSWWLAFN